MAKNRLFECCFNASVYPICIYFTHILYVTPIVADDGEGHIGTVCEVGRSGSSHSPENTVVVNWDSGHRTNYRVGYQNQYDLIIVDNAQVGNYHRFYQSINL